MDHNDLIALNSKFPEIVKRYRQQVAAIRADLRIPEQNKEKLIDQEREKFRTELGGIRAQFQEAANGKRKQINSVADRSYLPAGDAAAAHAADEKTYRRLRSLLDAGVEPDAILNDAVQRNDQRAIKVLADEYRFYSFAKNGRPDGKDVEAVGLLVEEAKYQTGNGAYRAAVDARKQVEEYERVFGFNASAVESELNGNAGSAAALLSHDRQVVRTDEEGQ